MLLPQFHLKIACTYFLNDKPLSVIPVTLNIKMYILKKLMYFMKTLTLIYYKITL